MNTETEKKLKERNFRLYLFFVSLNLLRNSPYWLVQVKSYISRGIHRFHSQYNVVHYK